MGERLCPGAKAAAAITWAARPLAEAGIERARQEAEALTAAAVGRSLQHLLLHPEVELSQAEASRLESLVSRRRRREPLSYVLGEVEFYSRSFRVTPAAIVPRPETEILVETALGRAGKRRAGLALEVGTGSGVIAITLARELPGLRVVATDISLDALRLARENCERHDVGEHVWLACADLTAGVRGRADCIVANLPYVGSGEFARLEPEVRDFEPRLGLDGGEDGLGPIRRVSGQLRERLSPGGFAALEVGAGQAGLVAKLLAAGGLGGLEVVADLAGIDRVVVGWREG